MDKIQIKEKILSLTDLTIDPKNFADALDNYLDEVQNHNPENLADGQDSLIKIVIDELLKYFKNKSLLAEFVFIELWWQGKYDLKLIAIHLLPAVLNEPNTKNLHFLDKIFRQLKDKDLADILSSILSEIVAKNYKLWLSYFDSLARHENQIVRCIPPIVIGNLLNIKEFTFIEAEPILKILMKDNDTFVQNRAVWCLGKIEAKWPTEVNEFIQEYEGDTETETQIILSKFLNNPYSIYPHHKISNMIIDRGNSERS